MALASPPELLAVAQPVSVLCNVSGRRFETTMRRASSLGRATANLVTDCRPISLCPFTVGSMLRNAISSSHAGRSSSMQNPFSPLRPRPYPRLEAHSLAMKPMLAQAASSLAGLPALPSSVPRLSFFFFPSSFCPASPTSGPFSKLLSAAVVGARSGGSSESLGPSGAFLLTSGSRFVSILVLVMARSFSVTARSFSSDASAALAAPESR